MQIVADAALFAIADFEDFAFEGDFQLHFLLDDGGLLSDAAPQREHPGKGPEHDATKNADKPKKGLEIPPRRVAKNNQVGGRAQEEAKGFGAPIFAGMPFGAGIDGAYAGDADGAAVLETGQICRDLCAEDRRGK